MRHSTTHAGQANPRKFVIFAYKLLRIFFSGQRHSASAADIYPQPSGWGLVSVGGTLLQGRTDLHTRPVDTWKVKLAKCGGTVWDPQEQALLQTNLSPPSTPQKLQRGQRYWGRGAHQCHHKNFCLTPLYILSQTPPGLGQSW